MYFPLPPVYETKLYTSCVCSNLYSYVILSAKKKKYSYVIQSISTFPLFLLSIFFFIKNTRNRTLIKI